MWSVYVLRCSDGTYYTGCTPDLTSRLNDHCRGCVNDTSTKLPVGLVAAFNFNSAYQAFDFQRYAKSISAFR